MSGAMDHLQTVNSFLRTLMALAVLGGLGTAGWFGYQHYVAPQREIERTAAELAEAQEKQRELESTLKSKEQALADTRSELAEKAKEIVTLNDDIRKKAAEIERLATSLRLHKMQRRLARINVLDTGTDSASGKAFSQIEFVELMENGESAGPARNFRIVGDMVYVDYLVVKFDDKYVEAADLERGMSICLLSRVFGEFQKPHEGYTLDEPGKQPGAYARGSVLTDLEKRIWRDFWNIANEPDKANELGIRALHGDAVSIKVVKGKSYRVVIRASGGPEIQVEDVPASTSTAAITSLDV